jgi:hypothetical protein
MVPFMDAFDSGIGWNPAGAWRLDVAHQGMGWFVDSSLREQASSLTFGTLIDLRAAQYPQLSFWQKAVLTGGESLAVEISLDGGLSWFAIDQQTGLISDWTQHTVDLSAYRGTAIGLRLTLSAFGLVPDGAISVGYWLDDLAILNVPPMPTAIPLSTDVPTSTPLPTEVPTEVPTPTLPPTEIPTATPLPTEVPTQAPPTTEVPSS